MVRTLKRMGKKGGIPAINELVMTFLNVTPKPILFLIFILLITTLATFLIPAMLNLFGYECIQVNDEIRLYQVPMDKFIEKAIPDIKQGLRDLVGFKDYQLPDDPYPDGDKRFLRVPAECFVEGTVNGTAQYGYSSACVNCTKSGWFRYAGSICLDDGYYDSTLITKYWIGTANFCYRCSPPDPYYYSRDYCFSTDECFFRILPEFESQVDDIVDSNYEANYYYQNIIKLGGQQRAQDKTQFVNIQCAEVDQPQLYFYSIKIFDKTLWIYLFIVYGLITFAMAWYGMIGLH